MVRKLLATVAVLLLGSGAAFAASQTFSVQVTVRAPITITVVNGTLQFGTVEQATSGTVAYTVNAATGIGSPPHSAGATAQAAEFTVNGESGQSATVQVDPSITLTSAPSGATLTVTPTVSAATVGPFTATPATVFVGGSLTVGTTTTAEPYTGTGTLTVLYQ